MDSQLDVVCIGNALVDTFLKIHEANEHIRVSKDTHEFCMKYGEKNLIDDCQFLLGGNACNLSVGLSRLGFKTALCAETGDDEFSQKIISGLKKDNVDLALLKQAERTPSAFAIALNFANERTLFVRHVQRQHDFVFEGILTKWIYLTSLGKEWRQAYKKAIDYVKKNNIKLAFNPGTFQLGQISEISEAIKAAEIIFVNKEEAQQILNEQNSREAGSRFAGQISNSQNQIKELLKALQNLGPKIVVLTDGLNGSYALDQNGQSFFLDVFPSGIIERTGAGDAYASGFLAGIMQGFPVNEAMRFGSLNAASVVEKTGAQPGLLKMEELKQRSEENKDFQAKEI